MLSTLGLSLDHSLGAVGTPGRETRPICRLTQARAGQPGLRQAGPGLHGDKGWIKPGLETTQEGLKGRERKVYVKQWVRLFSCTISLNPHKHVNWNYCFIDEETETQRG